MREEILCNVFLNCVNSNSLRHWQAEVFRLTFFMSAACFMADGFSIWFARKQDLFNHAVVLVPTCFVASFKGFKDIKLSQTL